MLSVGLKITWFSLSLSGLISSWIVVPAFARATERLWMSLLYCAANTVLQGIFCIGLIWQMDPNRMPLAFCGAQAILIHASWACIVSISTAITVSTASRVFTKSAPLCWLASDTLFSRLALVAGLPCIVLIAQVVAVSKVSTLATDAMSCDAAYLPWVRTLGYAGVTLVLVVPSFILSFATAIQVIRSRNARPSKETPSPPFHNDGLTLPPSRRHTKRRTYRTNGSPRRPAEPVLSAPSSIEPLFSSTRTTYAIPSPPDSSSPVGSPGRARVITGRTRYHLPFDWIETRYSPDFSLETYSKEHRLTPDGSPSPILFAPPSETRVSSRVTSPVLAEDTEKDSIHLNVHTGFSADGQFSVDDTISGSLHWARLSEDSSGRKSELAFASYSQDDLEYGAIGITHADRSSPFKSTRPPKPYPSDRVSVWPALAFQILSTCTQILAVISPLIDVASRSSSPAPLGTQYIALLLAAWGPCMVFGLCSAFQRLPQ